MQCKQFFIQIKVSILIGNVVVTDGGNRKKEKVKITVPLKYLTNFWRSLEMPLINCGVELSTRWIENCVLSGIENINNERAIANAGTVATFKITVAKLHILLVNRRQSKIIKTTEWRI